MQYQNIFQKIKVVYQDEHIILLDKPSGLTVNRSVTQKSETLQDYVEGEFSFVKGDPQSEFVSRSGIVHRLDKDTSGLILVAKDPKSFLNIQAQFKERTVTKEYYAVVVGRLNDDTIKIEAPIQRNPRKRLTYAVGSKGKPAETVVQKVKEVTLDGNFFTLVKVNPKTGRTHQIRVHLFALNVPVAVDKIYSSKKQYDLSQKYFNRLMLHAYKISFKHPKTGKTCEFLCEIPKDFNI